MSESSAKAGDLLREARQAQNLEIDALASMIKVTPAKLEALESGQHDQLPDANFTRALAMTVCRSLKIDPAPVLAALPAAKAIPLAPQKPALNQPFKESRGANLSFDSGESFDLKAVLKPQWLAPILLLVASLVVYFMPNTVQWPRWAVESDQPAAVQPMVASPASALVASVPAASQPVMLAPAAAATSSPAFNGGNSGSLLLTSRQPAWVEIRDGRSVLLSRTLSEGETVTLAGTPPFKLHLGNSSALAVVYQGQTVDLASHTQNNVARLELK